VASFRHCADTSIVTLSHAKSEGERAEPFGAPIAVLGWLSVPDPIGPICVWPR
jgi:hypothetical protein